MPIGRCIAPRARARLNARLFCARCGRVQSFPAVQTFFPKFQCAKREFSHRPLLGAFRAHSHTYIRAYILAHSLYTITATACALATRSSSLRIFICLLLRHATLIMANTDFEHIRMCHVNCQSLFAHLDEFRLFFSDSDFHIICMSGFVP